MKFPAVQTKHFSQTFSTLPGNGSVAELSHDFPFLITFFCGVPFGVSAATISWLASDFWDCSWLIVWVRLCSCGRCHCHRGRGVQRAEEPLVSAVPHTTVQLRSESLQQKLAVLFPNHDDDHGMRCSQHSMASVASPGEKHTTAHTGPMVWSTIL